MSRDLEHHLVTKYRKDGIIPPVTPPIDWHVRCSQKLGPMIGVPRVQDIVLSLSLSDLVSICKFLYLSVSPCVHLLGYVTKCHQLGGFHSSEVFVTVLTPGDLRPQW